MFELSSQQQEQRVEALLSEVQSLTEARESLKAQLQRLESGAFPYLFMPFLLISVVSIECYI